MCDIFFGTTIPRTGGFHTQNWTGAFFFSKNIDSGSDALEIVADTTLPSSVLLYGWLVLPFLVVHHRHSFLFFASSNLLFCVSRPFSDGHTLLGRFSGAVSHHICNRGKLHEVVSAAS